MCQVTRVSRPVLFAWVTALLLIAMLSAQARAAAPSADNQLAGLLSEADQQWLQAHGPVRLGLPEPGWPPFDMFTVDGQHQGITADYVWLIGERLGATVEIVKFPSFQDTLDALKRGDIDAMGSIVRTPARESFALFTLPYIQSKPVIITRKDDDKVGDLATLVGKTIAIEKGFASGEFLRSQPDIKLVEVTGTQEALETVSHGRADAYVGSLIASTYVIEHAALSNLEVRNAADLPISELRFAVSDRLPALSRLFDHALASISEKERVGIRKKWIGVAGLAPDWSAILRIAIPVACALIAIVLVVLIWNERLRRQIGRRRLAEETLASQMSLQLALLENLPALVAHKDTEARFVGCNRGL